MNVRRPRWRSEGVNLMLLGTAGSLMTLLAGCSGGNTTWSNDHHRNVYASEADCTADYAAAVCTAKGETRGNRFLGPGYRVIAGRPSPCAASDPGPGRAIASPKVGVERGGFGPRCRSGRSSHGGSRLSAWGG